MHPLLARVARLQSLAVFESAARLGSFTAAAHELGMTQPGVSRHISSLEREIALPLFIRSPNSVRLDAPGRALLAAVQDGFDTIEATLADLAAASPTFVVAANPGFAQRWLVPQLDLLVAALGDVDLRLRLFDRDAELDNNGYDAAIHLAPVATAPSQARHLFDEVVVPVASPDFAAEHNLTADDDPASLVRAPKLHLDGKDRRWMTWADWFAANDVEWSTTAIRMSYNNYPLVLEDAMAGRGVALGWRGLIDPLIDRGLLVAVGPATHNPTMAYQVLPGPVASAANLERLITWLNEITTP